MKLNDLLELSKELNCEYEIGLTSEINDFLENHENVTSFKVEFIENYFYIEVHLKEYDLIEVKDIFTSLVCFIEYQATFYVRDDFDDYIKYTLLSSMKDGKAFLCKAKFMRLKNII